MQAVILSVGDEVVAGQIVDSNAAWLADQLGELGVDVLRHEAIRDDEAAVEQAIRRNAPDCELMVLSGGLGPTEDDLTRHGVARAAGVGLILDEESLERIEDRFHRYGRPMPERNRIQAMVPEGATVLPNAQGTAPGFITVCGETCVVVLPGVPREMTAMFADHVRPVIEGMPHDRQVVRVERLRLFGLPESTVNQTIRHLMRRDANPLVGLLVSGGIISVKLTALARTQAEAAELIRPVREECRRLLGDAIFGEGTDELHEVVAALLGRHGKTVAIAESCTGGLIGHYLTEVPGISEFFLEDLVTYSNQAKIDLLGVQPDTLDAAGAVSEEVAAAMAEGVRRRSGADLGLSTTGIAGPTGGTATKPVGLVYCGLATEGGTRVEPMKWVGSRSVVKERAAKAALNALRLHLQGLGDWSRDKDA
ncbi:MAG: competence/damage-inducible protein A [Planctomycetota bacterium]